MKKTHKFSVPHLFYIYKSSKGSGMLTLLGLLFMGVDEPLSPR